MASEKLTPEQHEKVRQWMKQKGITNCPLCHDNRLDIGDPVVLLAPYGPGPNLVVANLNKGLTMIPLVCTNCANVLLLSEDFIGLLI